MGKKKGNILDLSALTDEERKKVERAISPRPEVFSGRWSPIYINSWKAAAKKKKMSIRQWVEDALNAAAAATDK